MSLHSLSFSQELGSNTVVIPETSDPSPRLKESPIDLDFDSTNTQQHIATPVEGAASISDSVSEDKEMLRSFTHPPLPRPERLRRKDPPKS